MCYIICIGKYKISPRFRGHLLIRAIRFRASGLISGFMIRKQQSPGKQVRFIVSKARLMISVIVPVYKVESYLHQCLDGILGQTYRDLEILLIDDGSPDRCGEICEEYAKKDSRIRVFHTENQGLSAARNLGLREAKGEYIGFVDSDDWIEPDMYEILLRRIEETGTDISASGVRNEYRNNSFQYSVSNNAYVGPEAIRALILDLSNGVWNKLYRRDCWTDIRFPEKHVFEDVATMYKVVLKAESLSCVPESLYHYRMRESSIIHSHSMSNLMDYWNAFYNRYLFLCGFPEFNNDRKMMNCLEKKVAFAATRTWFWIFGVPKEQRNYVFLRTVSDSMQKSFPRFGKREWGLVLRAGVFFSRYTNEVLFAVLHTSLRFFYFVSRKSKHKELFPSF